MRITIITIGSRGDVQPYVSFFFVFSFIYFPKLLLVINVGKLRQLTTPKRCQIPAVIFLMRVKQKGDLAAVTPFEWCFVSFQLINIAGSLRLRLGWRKSVTRCALAHMVSILWVCVHVCA